MANIKVEALFPTMLIEYGLMDGEGLTALFSVY